MKFLTALFLSLAIAAGFNVAHAGTPTAIFDVEKKIAYQQGQFGALYAQCGSVNEKAVIGGSLVAWRSETFQGLRASPEEHTKLEQIFDDAAKDVVADPNSCRDWTKQAAATWHGIVQLSAR